MALREFRAPVSYEKQQSEHYPLNIAAGAR